jgi:hypothetical protein
VPTKAHPVFWMGLSITVTTSIEDRTSGGQCVGVDRPGCFLYDDVRQRGSALCPVPSSDMRSPAWEWLWAGLIVLIEMQLLMYSE